MIPVTVRFEIQLFSGEIPTIRDTVNWLSARGFEVESSSGISRMIDTQDLQFGDFPWPEIWESPDSSKLVVYRYSVDPMTFEPNCVTYWFADEARDAAMMFKLTFG